MAIIRESLKKLAEVAKPVPGDEQEFVAKHVIKVFDLQGNDSIHPESPYQLIQKNVAAVKKPGDPGKEDHGHDAPGESERAYHLPESREAKIAKLSEMMDGEDSEDEDEDEDEKDEDDEEDDEEDEEDGKEVKEAKKQVVGVEMHYTHPSKKPFKITHFSAADAERGRKEYEKLGYKLVGKKAQMGEEVELEEVKNPSVTLNNGVKMRLDTSTNSLHLTHPKHEPLKLQYDKDITGKIDDSGAYAWHRSTFKRPMTHPEHGKIGNRSFPQIAVWYNEHGPSLGLSSKKLKKEEIELDEVTKKEAEAALGGPVKDKPTMPPGKQPAGHRYVRNLARRAMKKGIKEEVEQVDEASNKYEVTKTKSRKMPMEFDSEAKMHHYDVHHNDKRVGTLTHDTYFGETNGKLHGKDLPNIRNYGDNPHNQLHNFLKSKTGQKWAANLHKYQKEEVEQIDELNKVLTSYLSKRQMPSNKEVNKATYIKDPAERNKALRLANNARAGIRRAEKRLSGKTRFYSNYTPPKRTAVEPGPVGSRFDEQNQPLLPKQKQIARDLLGQEMQRRRDERAAKRQAGTSGRPSTISPETEAMRNRHQSIKKQIIDKT